MRATLAIFVFLLSRVAFAQAVPQMQMRAEPSTVGVGDTLHVQLIVSSADAMPADAQLGATQGFLVRGPSSAPSQTHISINGSSMDRYTLTTTWALQAQRVGTFHIGPPSVVVHGARYQTHALDVTVLPAGQAPRPPPAPSPFPPGFPNPFRFSPFDPWKGLIQGFDNPEQGPSAPQWIPTDPKLSLDAPRASAFFLHATVNKAAAVVGEQVTFSVYLYADTGERVEIDDDSGHDPNAADFVKHPLLREDQEPPLVGYAAIAGRTWEVKLLRRWALFPLLSGDLTIGPMRLGMLRPQGAAGAQRTSETLVVHVAEPPVAGRPPGYVPGDVGHFSLAAQVAPHEVDEGGAVGVHVEVSGTGNVPNAIATPVREGVDWLTPEVHDEVGPKSRDGFGGKRTLDFVVRMRRSGQVDLGDLTLPFWDPDQKKYSVARASLGMVRVAGSANASKSSGAQVQETLPGLPAPRNVLEGSRAPRSHADDSLVFWLVGIGFWPLTLGATVISRAMGRRALRAWRVRRTSPAAELKERLNAAAIACDGGDARTADAAICRALEAATMAHAGVSVRGAVGSSEVVNRLERAGVGRQAASSVADLIRECEAARFAPEVTDIISARDRWLRAQGAIRGMESRA